MYTSLILCIRADHDASEVSRRATSDLGLETQLHTSRLSCVVQEIKKCLDCSG